MNNIKCLDCGLVNWSTEVECKRCGSLLTTQEMRAQSRMTFTALESQPLLNKSLKALLIALGVLTLCTIFSRVLHLFSPEVAGLVVAPIMLAAAFASLGAQVLMLVRIFQQGILWGVATLFIPFVGFIAIIKFWDVTKRPFIASLLCLAIMIMGILTLPVPAKTRMATPQTTQDQAFESRYR